ncbi:MAG: SDR family NAD(P)-dependent oxidoreductase, partial [Alphaproteobacteria bacterium]
MRIWLITGASRGLGARIAAHALSIGDAVVATARDTATIAAEIREHEHALCVTLDVDNEAQARGVARSAVERFGRID